MSTSIAGVTLRPEVEALYEAMVADRRYLHSIPELGYQEVKTSAYIVEQLLSYGFTLSASSGGSASSGCEVFTGIATTGVVAIVRGEAGPGPCIGLRADMDALPLQETATVPYKSTHEGKMHACGHDGHVAAQLAVARLLLASKSRLRGVVKLVFQPAEEGLGGAKVMMDEGLLEDKFGPAIDEIYGIHLWSYVPLGQIGLKHGPCMAASDRVVIDVKGKGGHGAAPQSTVDAIVESAALVTSLQTVISRNKDPLDPAVLTIGSIHGGTNFNIICDHVQLVGTVRTFTPETKDTMVTRIKDVCCGVAATYGGEINVDYQHGFPATVNRWPEAVEKVATAARRITTPERIVPVTTMGAEDFSYFIEAKPGAFFFVGAGLEGDLRPHHKSVFDFDERALLVSATLYLNLIDDILGA